MEAQENGGNECAGKIKVKKSYITTCDRCNSHSTCKPGLLLKDKPQREEGEE